MNPTEEQKLLKKLKYDTCLVTPVSSGSSLQSVSSEVLVQCGKPLSARLRRIKNLEVLENLQATSTEDIDPANRAAEVARLAEAKRVENALLSKELRLYSKQLKPPRKHKVNETTTLPEEEHLSEERRQEDNSGCSIS